MSTTFNEKPSGSPPATEKLERTGTDGTVGLPRAATTATTGTGTTAVGQSLGFSAHTATASKVLAALGVADHRNGLADADAASRLEQYGPNRLKPPQKPSIFKICMRQIANAMTLVLSEYRRRIIQWSCQGFCP